MHTTFRRTLTLTLGGALIACAGSPGTSRSVSRAGDRASSTFVRIPTAKARPSPCGHVAVPPPSRSSAQPWRVVELGHGHRARLPTDFVTATEKDEWLADAVEPGGVLTGAWIRNPGDDLFVTALVATEIPYEGPRPETLDAEILSAFAAVEADYVEHSGLSVTQAISLLNYSAGWHDDRRRLHLDYGRVWKGCERREQYSHAIVLERHIVHLSLLVDGSAPSDLLERWLGSFFDEPFGGRAPSARRNLAGHSSNG